MVAIGLALASALAWGVSDFSGGLLTRRAPVIAVTLLSQAAGFAGLLAVWAAARRGLDGRALWLGLIAGVGGGLGLATLYQALALGTMSVVSPIVACGALVPFGISLATGERPSTLALTGAVVALAGAVLASIQEGRAAESQRRRAVLLAVASACTLGAFEYFLGLGGHHDALGVLVGARISSLLVLLGLAVAARGGSRLPRGLAPAVAAVGIVDMGANGLFALAGGRGLLSIVAVLGSLYPVVTVVLARGFLGERITGVQRAGVAIALAGVAVVSAF